LERRDLPVSFVAEGRAELSPADVQNQLTGIVDDVLEQVRGVDHPDVHAIQSDWEAIVTASHNDKRLCERAARLGLDAFDEFEVDDAVAKLLLESADRLPEPTRDDLFDAGVARSALALTLELSRRTS